ncbi:hypothetical protein RB653_008121 [Dictyostelium firmibasis]|uniref:Uncharacterized protein n=1 Tax=Dictyostelium firmibasis TaxID=79012 RepID=A0AAN7YZI6_9MYCE
MKYTISIVIILIISVFLYHANASVEIKAGYCGNERCTCPSKFFEGYGSLNSNLETYTIPNYPKKTQVWDVDMSYNETSSKLLIYGIYAEDPIKYPINDKQNEYNVKDCTYASYHTNFDNGKCSVLVICNDSISTFTFSYLILGLSILISFLIL